MIDFVHLQEWLFHFMTFSTITLDDQKIMFNVQLLEKSMKKIITSIVEPDFFLNAENISEWKQIEKHELTVGRLVRL